MFDKKSFSEELEICRVNLEECHRGRKLMAMRIGEWVLSYLSSSFSFVAWTFKNIVEEFPEIEKGGPQFCN